MGAKGGTIWTKSMMRAKAEARSREVNLCSVLLLKNQVQGGVRGTGRMARNETGKLGEGTNV